MVVTSEVLAILSWVYVYFRFRENWKWTIFVPANLHLLTFMCVARPCCSPVFCLGAAALCPPSNHSFLLTVPAVSFSLAFPL